jgi:hypothetical protein
VILDLNPKFAEACTNIALNLQLSKAQVVMMVQVATRSTYLPDLYRILGMHSVGVGAGRNLESRGLIYAPDPEWPGLYKLTEAGEHVFALLQIAGLVQRITDKIPQEEKVA